MLKDVNVQKGYISPPTQNTQCPWKLEGLMNMVSQLSSSVEQGSRVLTEYLGKGNSDDTELIHARYVIACDGARSWMRRELQVPFETRASDSTWGVLDIIPKTDFPDIRESCAIQSNSNGSIMTAPRENGLVRFYIQLAEDNELEHQAKDQNEEEAPRALVEIAQKIMQPYHLTYEHCDWWSIYPIKQGLVKQYMIHDRIFLAGDAAHTHSPKAGQGMNVSMQDTYNLLWKLCSVLAGFMSPSVLETYHSERHPVAEELLQLDERLVQAYEEEKYASSGKVEKIREQYAGFMSGVEMAYEPSVLVSAEKEHATSSFAKGIQLGMRLNDATVVNQADGSTTPLSSLLTSNGAWRLLVFAGDLRQPEQVSRFVDFADIFKNQSHLSRTHRTTIQSQKDSKSRPDLVIEIILVHRSPRESSFSSLNLPDVFHPADDDRLGWDYWKVFTDDGSYGEGQDRGAYESYGIDEMKGALVLCRPDQHVAWVGGMEELEALDKFISQFYKISV